MCKTRKSIDFVGGLVWSDRPQPLASLAMGFLTGAVSLPLLGALLHPILGVCIQKATHAGVRMVLLAALNNILMALVVVAFMRPEGSWRLSGLDWLAIFNGFLFFWGQWFSIQAVRKGDLAVHSSVLGAKILIIALLSLSTGLEASGLGLVLAVILATIAVFLVAGASWKGLVSHKATVGFTVVACVFFGLNDFITGSYGSDLGTARWITLMMGTSGVMSLFLIVGRMGQMKTLVTGGNAKWFVLIAGLSLGAQSVLVNIAFSEYAQPTLSNVVYSSRGMMAVIWLYFFGGAIGKSQLGRKLAGSALMLVALWFALT